MNIHLLRSPELNEETYRNVLHLLQQFRGPLHFQECEEEVLSKDYEEEEREWTNQIDFEKLNPSQLMYSQLVVSENSINFPYKEKTKTWDQLFVVCDKYRSKKKIDKNDIVVLLTDVGNKPNWFGGVSPNMKNYFVQTSNWEHFFGTTIDIRFPIAYEVIIWVMRFYMFPSTEAIMENIHKTPMGCIMDFCQDKSQIILKMRTADVCDSCMNHFKERDVPTLYTRQFFEILDGIREIMTFRGRSKLFHQPSRMALKGYTKKIYFTDLGGLELRLNPKEKALYLLFMNHPAGINLNELQDHKEELKNLYARFNNQSNPETIQNALELLVNPTENDMNIILSRINRKIKDAVGESLMDFYSIKGNRGERKGIQLDRELVVGLDV
ncbi:hypothetical protein [Flavobacterium nackdongense]|jgi:hypothetical protein|uniref:Uncharacterized protein n=1 Tax=Flavobacterium nackdongense TaxID=2547394 RepID=A0A4P6Y9Q4_9FLAO|nr:hypothetical protein [Flavobacterium nackdongense]QBN17257.1 hypothetical protein E1750_00030 [Flavobacterium nackdongense]